VQLREYLQERLPEYLVPAVFVVLESLPLTANGKVDRKALPIPEGRPGGLVYEAPRTPVEELLAQIWSQVLRVERVGIHDNFFELGGDSIKSVRLCNRISQEAGQTLPLSTFFSQPTVHETARWIAAQARAATSYRIPLRAAPGARHMLAFLPTILGSGLHYSRLAQHMSADSAIATCRLPGTAPNETILGSLEEMAAHCKRQLVSREEYEEWSLVGWSFGGVLAYETARQMVAEGLPIRRLVLIDALLPPETSVVSAGLHEQELQHTFEKLMMMHAVPAGPASNTEILAAIYKANIAALRAYRPPLSSFPITEIRTAQTVHMLSTGIYAGRPIGPSNDLFAIVPGDHYSIFSQEHLGELARAVNAAMRN
jgi:thioesterase domain-containing protein/acyl carrier protein